MMTDERWCLFAERVPVGTQIYGEWYHGIILENMPYTVWEIKDRLNTRRAAQKYEKELEGAPMLKVNLFTHPFTFPIDVSESNFLVGGVWLTFDQVMSLPTVRE